MTAIGGRGAYSVRRREGVVAPATLAGGGASPKAKPTTAGGGTTIDTPFGKMTVVTMSHNGQSRQKPNKTDGKLVVMDSKGKRHESIQVSSGSTRVTYEFKDFALKFEGVFHGGYQGQNARDYQAYQNLHPRLKQYAAQVYTKNKRIDVPLNGKLKNVQVIAVERITPIKGSVTKREHARLKRQYDRITNGKYGTRLRDLGFPDRDGKTFAYNLYFARKKNGKAILKAYDIPL